jgi:hypothetical protein
MEHKPGMKDEDDLTDWHPEPLPPEDRFEAGHRFLGFLGEFGFKADEAVAYNYYAGWYLGGPLNRIIRWQHDLDESYLKCWEHKDTKPKWRRL